MILADKLGRKPLDWKRGNNNSLWPLLSAVTQSFAQSMDDELIGWVCVIFIKLI